MQEFLRRHRARIALSIVLVLGEAAGWVVLPRVIGLALDDHRAGSNRGVVLLGVVGVTATLLHTIRHLHDVRLYARIYEEAGEAMSDQEIALSAKTARLNMLREVVDYLEYELPDLLLSIATFVGTLAFLFGLSRRVFLAGLAVTAVIVILYALTTRRTIALNEGYNDEYEKQVDVLQHRDRARTRRHIRDLDGWLIKLQDLESTNVALSLLLATGLQIFAIVSLSGAEADDGHVLSIVLYVVEFSIVVPFVPHWWQGYLRITDILERLTSEA